MKVAGYMDGFYKNFVAKVAEGRHSTPERIDAVAQGRVWTGAQAKERGLVDALGGLDTAVSIAKQRAHIPAMKRWSSWCIRRGQHLRGAHAAGPILVGVRASFRPLCGLRRGRRGGRGARRAGHDLPSRRAARVDAVHLRPMIIGQPG